MVPAARTACEQTHQRQSQTPNCNSPVKAGRPQGLVIWQQIGACLPLTDSFASG